MFGKIFNRVLQQLILLVVVALVLLAAYVSAARQFMPAVEEYREFFQEQISSLTGLPVSIESLSGSFEGFNPIITVNGLRLLVTDASVAAESQRPSALVFSTARLIVDAPRSIWQRRWVLRDFVVESLEVDVEQTAEGNWRLSGTDIVGGGGINLGNIFRTFQRVVRLDLNDMEINVRPNDGSAFSLTDASAAIQNLGASHYLHIDALLQPQSVPLAFSLEVNGNEFEAITGQAHVRLPEAEYSSLINALAGDVLSFSRLNTGGDFWIGVRQGDVSAFTAMPTVSSATFQLPGSNEIAISNISGAVDLRKRSVSSPWELRIADMSMEWDERNWNSFNVFAEYLQERELAVHADHLDITLLTRLALDTGLLSETATAQLANYAPAGSLRNLVARVPLGDTPDVLTLRTNVEQVEVSSVSGSPNLWGVDGYVEMEYDSGAGLASGRVEVESQNFSINIPSTFTSTWDYDYVNGALDFSVDLNDGREIRLISNIIIAESEAVDGHVKFTSVMREHPDNPREADLELVVGAQRLDSAYRSLYLPDGTNVQPGLKQTMEWLEAALTDGEVYDAGVIFRGSTVRGSAPEEKTFQSYYRLRDGSLTFDESWPALNNLSATVVTDDSNIDINIEQARSLGVVATELAGQVRRDSSGNSWLTVAGDATAATDSGLNYLQNAPVGESLQQALGDWEAAGDMIANLMLRIPFNNPDAETEYDLQFDLAENALFIPAYDIDLNELAGTVSYDSVNGLGSAGLSAEVFGNSTQIALGSRMQEGELLSIDIQASGSASTTSLIAWPQQSEFVRRLLNLTTGEMEFDLQLTINQDESVDRGTQLTIDSMLTGVTLNLPPPFNKAQGEESILHLDMNFGGENQYIAGLLGDELRFDLEMEGGQIKSGLLMAGRNLQNFSSMRSLGTNGLVILGDVRTLHLDQWTRLISALGDTSAPSDATFGDSIAFVDVRTEIFELYQQELPSVVLRITPNSETRSWDIVLNSESVAGNVVLPFAPEAYLDIDLDYLRLPGDEAGDTGELFTELEGSSEEERIDVLADLDPRQLPAMHFATDEFMIGDRPYGSWDFTFNPATTGARVTDLQFDFRGLRVGMENTTEDGVEPYFNWSFDGSNHHSELRGIIYADDMADVLRANGYAASFNSNSARFDVAIDWPGSPAFFAADGLSGSLGLDINEGRFQQGSSGAGALRLISIINFDAIMRRLRFSDDLLRSGLAYDEIYGTLQLESGVVHIEDRLVISGPSSLYQITGDVDLQQETISGEMYVTLPVSNNIPWLGLLTANLPLAVGAYLFDRIFGDQVDSLTSAVYTLEGPWEGLQPEFSQAFGSPDSPAAQNAN